MATKGACVAAPGAGAPAMSASKPSLRSKRPFRILIIEDNADAADTLRMALDLLGWPREIYGGYRLALVAAVLGGARVLYWALESLLEGRIGADLVKVGDCHPRAFAREEHGNRLSDAARRTGDNRDLIIKTHDSSPVSRVQRK